MRVVCVWIRNVGLVAAAAGSDISFPRQSAWARDMAVACFTIAHSGNKVITRRLGMLVIRMLHKGATATGFAFFARSPTLHIHAYGGCC